jgi:hypothetical protein
VCRHAWFGPSTEIGQQKSEKIWRTQKYFGASFGNTYTIFISFFQKANYKVFNKKMNEQQQGNHQQ